MRNNTQLWKRSLAALLSLVMVLGMLPTFGLAPVAYAAGEESSDQTGDTGTDTENQTQQSKMTGNYITLPITIRDFAADGMLFEYNEVDKSTFTRNDDGTVTWGDPRTAVLTDRLTYNQNPTGDETIFTNQEPWIATYNATDAIVAAAGYRGIYVHPQTSTRLNSFGDWWYCVIIDANGNVLKTLDVGEGSKATFDADMKATYVLADGKTTATPAYSIWAWRDPSNLPQYNLLSKATKGQHQVGFYDTVSAALESGDSLNFYMGIPYSTSTDPASKGNMGIYVWSGNAVPGGYASYTWWTRIVCDSATGQVVDIIPSGTEDSTYGTSAYKIVMIFADDTASLAKFSHITTSNMSEYQIVTPTCDRGGALFIERTIQLNESNTRGFGLLFTKSSDAIHNMYDDADENWGTIDGSLLIDNDPTNVPGDIGTNVAPYKEAKLWDEGGSEAEGEYYAIQKFYAGVVRTNLVAEELDKFGNPRYTKGTVTYLAEYMQKVMATPEKDANGVYNSHHVMGDKMFEANFNYIKPGSPTAVYDLAEMIRMNVGDNFSITDDDKAKLGDYDESRAKFEAGNLDTVMDVKTWFDAAYYLLHSTWHDSKMEEGYLRATDGYGLKIDNYNRIHLRETTNADGQICYVFNAAYDNTTFDMQLGEIYNSPFGQKADGTYYNAADRTYSVAVLKGETDPYKSMGIALPVNRWDPLGPCGAHVNAGFGMSGNTYGELTGAKVTQDWSEYYDETNYNLSLEGHAQFVYQQGANQYFTFTGDDDVYLYINGHRVLDIGGAHGISKVRIDLNDVAAYCGMVDGGTYPFDFFYLERHGTAANFGIETNIQIAEPSMNTVKTGYQNGTNTGYGGPVDATKHVGYTFELQNNGDAHIYNLEFRDDDIGVYVGWDGVKLYPDDYTEEQKELYDINDLYLIYWDKDGNITEYLRPGDVTEEIIRTRLDDGLAPGARIGIFGFKYKIPWNTMYVKDANGNIVKDANNNPVMQDTFTNTVYTKANADPEGKGKVLNGVSDWKVVKMQVPYTAFHVYDWVNKDVSQNPKTVCDWRSPEAAGLPLGGVTVPKEDLVAYFEPHNIEVPEDAVIVLCTGAGYEDEYNLNKNASIDPVTGGITYKSKTVGKDTIFFKVKWDSNKNDDIPFDSEYRDLVFSYEVYTYGSTNNIYVLDYGLSVELAGETFGFQNNENLENNHNSRTLVVSEVTGMVDAEGNPITSQTGNYGTFTWATEDEEGNPITSLKYTPEKIINNTDEVFAKFRIMEEEALENGDKPSIYNSVEMVQKITTAPASVVYYEENFPGITYISEGENKWVQYETVTPVMVQGVDENGQLLWQEVLDENGDPVLDENNEPVYEPVMVPKTDENGNIVYESVAGTEQSADQDSNYGSDPNYEEDKVGVFDTSVEVTTGSTTFTLDTTDLDALQAAGIDALNSYLGLGGADSNGTVKELVVKETDEVMYFDFVGTGFEIVSRTTQNQYALINVQVQKDTDGDGVYETVYKQQPVITESKGGDIYQVPVISITGLPRDQYRVVVTAAKSTYNEETGTGKVRVLYIDGIRIYGPLSDTEALEYYNPEEYRAQIFEVKQMIQEGKMIYADVTKYIEEGVPQIQLVTGVTYIEDVEGSSTLIEANSVDEYMSMGPNNELYLEGSSAAGMIVFFLTPIEEQNGQPYPEGARTIEIGAHRKVDIGENGYAVMTYDNDPQAIIDRQLQFWKEYVVPAENTYTVSSGTEMYYTIDLDDMEPDAQGRYLVMISSIGSENFGEDLSLTNIKIAGYDISFAEPLVRNASKSGNVLSEPAVAAAYAAISGRVRAMQPQEPEVEEIPVNENLKINSAVLKTSKVVSGGVATLTVKATSEATKIIVMDADGNEVKATRNTRSVKNGVVTYTFIWKVTGSRGQQLNYNVRVYDANDLASVNTETVTVTIK